MSAPDTPKDGVLYHTCYPVSAQRDSRVASVLRREENSPWGPSERPVVSSRCRLYPELRSRRMVNVIVLILELILKVLSISLTMFVLLPIRLRRKMVKHLSKILLIGKE
jgi:hypothetical protein